MPFKQELTKIAGDVEIVLDEILTPIPNQDPTMMEIARYAALDAGKRLRTFLTVQSASLFGVSYNAALRAGAIVEIVHNFSLIHDDLPCIDNDTLRRGRPSVWAKYGESNAVLAGDLLLNWAFKTLVADDKITTDPNKRIEMLKLLANMTHDMIIGEWMDIQAESGKFQTESEVNQIQSLKTAHIFMICTMFGAILGGATDDMREHLRVFTEKLGLCFQITDDILDATGDPEKVGKTLKKDSAAGKATYISLYGIDGARAKARELAESAKAALGIFGDKADNLRELMDYMITRES
jgi:farnesyl diphosphate synthase